MALNINFAKGKGWNCPIAAPSFTSIGTVGTAGQMAAGHVLTAASFPSAAVGSNLSWWMLNALTDGSGNGRTLTNNGSTPLTGADIFGTAGNFSFTAASSQYLSASGMGTTLDALFDPGPNDFAGGGWFKITDISANRNLFSQYNADASKCVFQFMYNSNGNLYLLVSSDGIVGNAQTIISYPYPVASTGYHHLAIRHVNSTKTFYLYVDGVVVASGTYTGTLYTAGSGNRRFNIGTVNNAGQYFQGVIDEFFFGIYSFTDNDIAKIYARRYSHNQNITPVSQKWIFQAQNGGQTRELLDNIVDMQANDLYYDLSGEAATTQVSLRLANIY